MTLTLKYALSIFMLLISEAALAVDHSSRPYEIGMLLGKIFVAFLIFFIIRKFFFNKR